MRNEAGLKNLWDLGELLLGVSIVTLFSICMSVFSMFGAHIQQEAFERFWGSFLFHWSLLHNFRVR